MSDHLNASYVGHIIPVKKANVSEPEFVSWLTYNEINSNFISMERDTTYKLRIDLHVIERNKYLVTEPEFCPPQTGCGPKWHTDYNQSR